jgi:hypothetical protein
MSTTSQVTAILAHIKNLATPVEWDLYTNYLNNLLVSGRPVQENFFQGLDTFVLCKPALSLFHHMLKQELITELPRSLPPSLDRIFPWAESSIEATDSCVEFAQERYFMIGQAKDVVAAREEARRVCLEAQRQDFGAQPVFQLSYSTSDDSLIDRLGALDIGTTVDSMQELSDALCSFHAS